MTWPLLTPPPLPQHGDAVTWDFPSRGTRAGSERCPNTALWPCHPAPAWRLCLSTPLATGHCPPARSPFTPSPCQCHLCLLRALALWRGASDLESGRAGLFCPAVCPWGELLPARNPGGRGRAGCEGRSWLPGRGRLKVKWAAHPLSTTALSEEDEEQSRTHSGAAHLSLPRSLGG